jgi:hypothetical protein
MPKSGGSATCQFSAPDDAAPTELEILTGRVYYKYFAPNGAARHSIQPQRRKIPENPFLWYPGSAESIRFVALIFRGLWLSFGSLGHSTDYE